ncbi:putative fatty acyl-CoA reductase CG5065 isoform X2 [Manduca sexta]|uniref:putative fatty acyl-CoA reductase CG5065 isoform X2 n=1 Tax=Manduca sexta TaxID=7130 RepID=UPI00188F0388|nr:putative fatty acyl-CoA reductase CG5065 isoform X2 [Manduca sexta]
MLGMSINKEYVPVADFYAGRSVFLTGVSGFLGKVILEKLLYSCKHINNVYVMIREKKGVSAEERFRDIINLPVFTKLKEERPEDLNKIIPVTGDLLAPNLGIEKSVEESFVNKVSVVLHSAATIKYNQQLDEALNNNLEGTRRVLELCQRMPRIRSFVHVSTAYSNMDREVIDEVVYPAPAALRDVYTSIKRHGVTDEKLIKKILNGKPNTYVFSKALAENMLVDQHGDIPTTIVRPSTVAAAMSDPLPGWVDNWFAATGIFHVTGSGNNRVIFGRKSNVLDIIPVDYVSNLIIVAAARKTQSKDIPVFNSCSSSCNPVNFGEIFMYLKEYYVTNKYHDAYPMLLFSRNKWIVNFLTFLLQMLPAKVADVYVRTKGQKPRYAKLQSKVVQMRDLHKSFTEGSWVIKSDGTRSLYSSLSPADKQNFPFDPTLINWQKFTTTYCHGIRRFLLRK